MDVREPPSNRSIGRPAPPRRLRSRGLGRACLLAAATAALVLSFAACGSSSSTSTTSSTSDTSPGNFTVDTPEGTASLNLNGKLPAGWPSDFPVPKGATPGGSGSLSSSTKSYMIAVYETSTSGQDTYNFYKNSSGLTITQSKSVGVGPAFVGHLEFSGSHTGSVTITHVDRTLIVVYLTSPAKTT